MGVCICGEFKLKYIGLWKRLDRSMGKLHALRGPRRGITQYLSNVHTDLVDGYLAL